MVASYGPIVESVIMAVISWNRICLTIESFMQTLGYGVSIGAVHKVRHARGGEVVREGVTVCDRGGGQEHVTSCLYKFLSYI